jgi:hypothetical protein
MGDIEPVLNGDEHILWEGRPAVLPFFVGSLLAACCGAIILLAVLRGAGGVSPGAGEHIFALWLLSPFVLVGILLAVAFPLYRFLAYMSLFYAVTDKRVLLKSGIVAKNVLMLDFDQIGNVSVNIDFLDIFLGFGRSGSIALTTRGSIGPETIDPSPNGYVLSHIPHPYDVFKSLQQAEFDVKTDMEYPNRLRPDANPGYSTTYPPR